MGLRVYLLGQFAVEREGAPIPASAWKRRRPVELLTHVALAPGGVLHKEELIDRMWPEKDLDAGANNLYRAVHDLRRIAGDPILSLDRGAARLGADVWVDVSELERLIGSDDLDEMERGLALYRGPLLPDDPYTDAISSRREGLRQRFVDGSLRVAKRLQDQDPERQMKILRRLLEVDVTLESAHRMLMGALARAGRKNDAIKQFGLCTQLLRERLDAAPSAETVRLSEAIGRDEVQAPAPAVPESTGWTHAGRRLMGRQEPTPLRGRDQDLERLARLVKAGAGVALIIGEAGIGKSRFAVAGARVASEQGQRVLAGLGYDFAGQAPYTPFVDAWADHLRSAAGDAAANPFLRFQPTPGASAQEDRLRLFESVERSIQSLAGEGAVYLVIEDLHWADESSLLLFHHLARASSHLPLVLVGTLRSEEVSVGSSLHTLLGGLRRERLDERIRLDRLGPEATRALVADTLGSAADAATCARVLELSGGNAYYAQEVARALAEHDGDAEFMVPGDLLDTVRQRVQGLGREAERFFAAAAVVGVHFHFETVRAALALGADEALEALERGLAARIVEEDGDEYRFQHALTRQALQDALTHARRDHLHRAVAEALEGRADAPERSEQLAFHYQEAGLLDRALPHVLAAARRAQARLGFGEAVAFSERALELMDAVGAPAGPERFAVMQTMGAMRVALGDLDSAVAILTEAAALRGEGFQPSPVEVARCLRFAGLARTESGELDEADRFLGAALDTLGELDRAELSALLYQLSQLRWHQSRHEEAYELAKRCLRAAEHQGDTTAIAKGYEMIALACHSLGEWNEGRDYEDKRQALAGGALDVASAFDVHL